MRTLFDQRTQPDRPSGLQYTIKIGAEYRHLNYAPDNSVASQQQFFWVWNAMSATGQKVPSGSYPAQGDALETQRDPLGLLNLATLSDLESGHGGLAGGINLYSYVDSRPTGAVDPEGLYIAEPPCEMWVIPPPKQLTAKYRDGIFDWCTKCCVKKYPRGKDFETLCLTGCAAEYRHCYKHLGGTCIDFTLKP